MPGTIQVSVVDFLDLPSSSSSSSSVSVKVSMGKREYQTSDKGDFSFPLMTLRDDVAITLHDAQGNELSQTGVETRKVIEKGMLEEFLPVEGGGRLHITLQFILSMEERKRIQELREIALKKNQVKILTTSNPGHSEMAALDTGSDNNASSYSLNLEVTDSQERLGLVEAASNTWLRIQDESAPNPEHLDDDQKFGSGNGEGITLIRVEHHEPIHTDGSEEISSKSPLSRQLEYHHDEADQETIEKIDTSLSLTCIPEKPISSFKVYDPQMGFAKSLVARKNQSVSGTLREDRYPSSEKQSSLKSSVKKMISAFETSLTQKHFPLLMMPKLKSSLKKTMSEGSLKEPDVKEVIEKNRRPELSLSSIWEFKDANLQQSQNCISKKASGIGVRQHKEENTNGLETCRQELSGTSAVEIATVANFPHIDTLTLNLQPNKTVIEGTIKNEMQHVADTRSSSSLIRDSQKASIQKTFTRKNGDGNEIGLKHRKEVTINEQKTVEEEFVGASSFMIHTVAGSMSDRPVDREQSCTVNMDQQDFALELLGEDEGRACIEDSDRVNILPSSSETHQSVAHSEVEKYLSNSSESCIMPEESRHLCIATGSKQVTDLAGGCYIFAESNQRKGTSLEVEETDEENKHVNTSNEVRSNGKSSRKPTVERSAHVGSSRGLILQVVRVATVVAFGAIIFLNRQHRNR